MAKAVYTEVDGQKLKLTNLHKKLYAEADITKAEVVSYFLEVAKYMMPHVAGFLDTRLDTDKYPALG